MISSTSSPDRTPRAELVSATAHASHRSAAPKPDRISIEHAEYLRAELQRQPELRSEVVERASALAKDPSYPPIEVMRHVAAQIVAAPDLSDDES